jgi:hypothetical protein
MSDDRQVLLTRLYERFNARDVDAAVAMLHPDVDWPNGWRGGREHGREAVRAYWLARWAEIDPQAVPQRTEALGSGGVRVHVHQIVRDTAGTVISDSMVLHDYTFADGLIVRMDFGTIK